MLSSLWKRSQKHGDAILWPPGPLHLTQMNFFLWRFMKHEATTRNVDELKTRIKSSVA